ncbi:MAG: hypothetical protein PWQ82_1135 [Thermosediminibacterales bacterium]|nr:hypothetical protein [Thermosediminibacterales bacterium]MDK2835671.1 hypothetical protein [Thermosediminibacterales bacterium]
MKTVALLGPSGTGKSHHAILVAYELGLELIIDDGLLIKGARVVAGTSAKREATKLGAVKRAIFMDETHRKEVKQKIDEISPSGILILSTSLAMAHKITEALELPFPDKIINIYDVATEREIKTAITTRKKYGKHVIPVPTLEIKKDFSGYLLDPLKIFDRRGSNVVKITEKSVVRPTYSYMGRYTISDTAISSVVSYVSTQTPGIVKTGRVFVKNQPSGIIIDLDVVIEYGKPIKPILKQLQKDLAKKIEYITALNVLRINVTASKLYFPTSS